VKYVMPSIPNFDNIGADIGAAGAGIDAIGKLAGGFMSANTYGTEAKFYQQAAGLAEQNAQAEIGITETQQYLEDLKLKETQASVLATTFGNGLGFGGSTAAILQSNAQQGELARALTTEQGAMNETAYQQQATTLQGEAAAAKSAASSSILGGILGAAGGIAKGAALLF
jgi:hypothetical protein